MADEKMQRSGEPSTTDQSPDMARMIANLKEHFRLEQEEINAAKHAGGFPQQVSTAGSGPYPIADFDRVLKEKGIGVFALGLRSLDVLVLGRCEWDIKALDDYIEARAGAHLRVYSQEMFLAFMATGMDPYDEDALLKAFGKDHPALEHLSDRGFDWVNTTIVPGKWGGDHGDPETWPKESPLKLLGYTVGLNGQSQWDRQKTLRAAFTGILPSVPSQKFLALIRQ